MNNKKYIIQSIVSFYTQSILLKALIAILSEDKKMSKKKYGDDLK